MSRAVREKRGDAMFGFKRKKAALKPVRAEKTGKDAEFGLYQALSSGQRATTGDRSELCAGAMNNNQRLAALQMLRGGKNQD